MKFSGRLPQDYHLNRLSEALETLSPEEYRDLTESNPTRCAFPYSAHLLQALADPRALRYEPDPHGLAAAREALAAYLRGRGIPAEPQNLFLASGTSEAFSYLVKLLADPGEAFLTPHPSYPLHAHLLELESCRALPYQIRPVPGWPLERQDLRTPEARKARAFVAVEPHNPLGSRLSPEDAAEVLRFCEETGAALVLDEVFADTAPEGKADPWAKTGEILVFRLGGLSKAMGLPQLKLSWILVQGPAARVAEAQERLEWIADAYLSVNTPVQAALPALLAHAPRMQRQIRERVARNRAYLRRTVGVLGDRLQVRSGTGAWCEVLEVEDPGMGEEDLALELLTKRGVRVHPGGWYDFERECFLVVSLLPEPEIFEDGLGRLYSHFAP